MKCAFSKSADTKPSHNSLEGSVRATLLQLSITYMTPGEYNKHGKHTGIICFIEICPKAGPLNAMNVYSL